MCVTVSGRTGMPAVASFDGVHSPIGIDIGAETPEELAVSIVGESIKVREKRKNVCRKRFGRYHTGYAKSLKVAGLKFA